MSCHARRAAFHGRLYGGLTIEQIKSKMVSERRNELIAETFHEIHLIEKWGRGINTILTKDFAGNITKEDEITM